MFIVCLRSLPLAYSSRLSLFKSKSRINTGGSNKKQKRKQVRVRPLGSAACGAVPVSTRPRQQDSEGGSVAPGIVNAAGGDLVKVVTDEAKGCTSPNERTFHWKGRVSRKS